MTLPQQQRSRTENKLSYPEQEQAQQARIEAGSPRQNVLIVDDNPTNRKLLNEILQSEGYATVEAADGLEALFALESAPFDIVVCDILMPNLDGYGLCTEVRQRAELRDLFFILYSAIDFTPNDEKLGLELGADRIISKQGSPLAILRAIEDGAGERREHLRRTLDLPSAKEMKKYDVLMIRQLEEKSIELEQARNELRSLNERLEMRVAERTVQVETANKQLEALNNQLEQKVADRTKELAAQNDVLELRTEELTHSNADLEQFASAASHDLQEPLRAVAGCIQVFERKYRGKLDHKSDELIRMIVDGAVRMKALIDGLLAYSRAVVDEKLETIDTEVVVQQVLADLDVAITESKAEVVVGKLPSLRFAKRQFQQLLLNLVGNAIKYRSALGPQIAVRAERQSDSWMFSVADNGIGFEQLYAEKVFGVFQRLHTRDRYPGTGIGLAIGKKIVERRRGKIWVESEPDPDA